MLLPRADTIINAPTFSLPNLPLCIPIQFLVFDPFLLGCMATCSGSTYDCTLELARIYNVPLSGAVCRLPTHHSVVVVFHRLINFAKHVGGRRSS